MSQVSFREFLSKLSKQQHHKERRERRDEWLAAVGRLMSQLRAWIAESDPDQVLDVFPIEVERAEPALGVYTVPALTIGSGDATPKLKVFPLGRDSIGTVDLPGGSQRAQGRVDLTDGARKYVLYRLLQDGKDAWYVVDEDWRAKPLDRQRLEEMIQDLLS